MAANTNALPIMDISLSGALMAKIYDDKRFRERSAVVVVFQITSVFQHLKSFQLRCITLPEYFSISCFVQSKLMSMLAPRHFSFCR